MWAFRSIEICYFFLSLSYRSFVLWIRSLAFHTHVHRIIAIKCLKTHTRPPHVYNLLIKRRTWSTFYWLWKRLCKRASARECTLLYLYTIKYTTYSPINVNVVLPNRCKAGRPLRLAGNLKWWHIFIKCMLKWFCDWRWHFKEINEPKEINQKLFMILQNPARLFLTSTWTKRVRDLLNELEFTAKASFSSWFAAKRN